MTYYDFSENNKAFKESTCALQKCVKVPFIYPFNIPLPSVLLCFSVFPFFDQDSPFPSFITLMLMNSPC